MKLFPYQEELYEKLVASFRKKSTKRVVACAVTGFGKTRLAAEISRRALNKGNRTCILCHRIEILLQFYNAIRDLGIMPGLIVSDAAYGMLYEAGIRAELVRTDDLFGQVAPVFIGMVETFNRRVKKGFLERHHVDLFIFDEAHYGAYPKVLDQIDARIIGLTATPVTTGKPNMNEMYDDIVLGAQVPELILMNRLCSGKTFSVSYDFNKVKKKGKEFEEKALIQEFKKAKLYDGAVKKYMELCPDRKCICYNVNVEHSRDVEQQFRNAGIRNVYHVDGNTGDMERREIFSRFEADKHAVLCNVGIATTGYDCPDVTCIIENFATMSIVKHHQCIGRGARVIEGKDDFYIIDMGRNWVRFSAYGQPVDWVDIFHNPANAMPKDENENKKTNRECDECGFIVKMKTRFCPNCNMVWTTDEIQKFVEKECSLEEIREWKLSNLPVRLRKDFSKMTLDELKEFGQHMGYQKSWAWTIHNKIANRKNSYSRFNKKTL